VAWPGTRKSGEDLPRGHLSCSRQGDHKTPFMIMAARCTKRAWTGPTPGLPETWTGCCCLRLTWLNSRSLLCQHPLRPHRILLGDGQQGGLPLSSRKGIYRQDAFTARGQRDPAISFAAINEIQKTKMLEGESGDGTYISGWHRGVIRKMEKFVAYTNAHVELTAYSHLSRADIEAMPAWL